MKLTVISDSFKGTLSSKQICDIAREEAQAVLPGCIVDAIPVADGGEGTVEAVLCAAKAERIELTVSGPFREPCPVSYARMGDTAVIEMAQCAGLPGVGERKDPKRTTTYGVGEMLLHAAERGCTELWLGLGGSATNDGGCGCAAALGVKFFDREGREFVPTGGTLQNIERIDPSNAAGKLKNVSICAMCDVENPLYGPTGAAYIFAPQKGADEKTVRELDEGLKNLSRVIKRDCGRDVAHVPGAGAAGGMGAGILAFMGGELVSGIEALLTLTDFDRRCADSDLVITGEGRLDEQSLHGKVISGVARHTRALGKPLIALVGCIGDGGEGAYEIGVDAVFPTCGACLPFEELALRAESDYRRTLRDVLTVYGIKR